MVPVGKITNTILLLFTQPFILKHLRFIDICCIGLINTRFKMTTLDVQCREYTLEPRGNCYKQQP